MTYIDYEFEFPIQHEEHVLGVIECCVNLIVWGIDDFNLQVSKLFLRDADSREWFKLDLEAPRAKEISTWLMQHKRDVLEERVLEVA